MPIASRWPTTRSWSAPACALLQQQGVEVVCEADDGQALLDALSTTSVDVVLSDIRMPGVDGIQALQQLRARGDRTRCCC